MAKRKKVTHKFHTRRHKGKLEMICRNSIEDTSYFAWPKLAKGPRCFQYSEVSEGTSAVLCWRCVCKTVPPPDIKGGYVSKGRPRGWQFMKEFVDKDGNVFHKGKEQPKLKGTIKPTKIEPKKDKKKLSKSEKMRLEQSILQQMAMVRGNLKKAKWKKDINAGNTQLRKLQRKLKKVK